MVKSILPTWSLPHGIHAFCTTRTGGVSQAPYHSFNLAEQVGDDQHNVAENRRRLRQQFNLPEEPCWINQSHGNRVVMLEQDSNRDADAAISRKAGTVAVVMTADCLPILICNKEGSEVAAVHAGWRGLQAGVIQATLAAMKSPASQLMAWIGPGISQICFEVGDEVRQAFLDSTEDATTFFQAHGAGHWLCDLAGLAELVLTQQQLGEIYRESYCSYTDEDLFFSYRRDQQTGRMASLIWINPEA